jgi:uncharacterized repeat protein (TIGR01451 family)
VVDGRAEVPAMTTEFSRARGPLIATLALIPGLLSAAPDVALRMSVDPVVPTPGQPVEFIVVVTNEGTSAATDVVVSDQLSSALAIPAGMAAFPSSGTFDPLTGNWSLGTLASGATATLMIPAVVVANPQPPCSVNAAIRCADLAIAATGGNLNGCGDSFELKYWVTVTNAGPDDAGMVYLDMTQTPAIIPGLKLTGSQCDGLRCTVAGLPAGASVTFDAKSGDLDFNNRKYVTLEFAVSSADVDYETANNQQADNLSIPPAPDCDPYDDSDGGGCFIATAAYGSMLEPHVVALREFRDRYLRNSALGRAFIRFYYRYSPPVAAVIGRYESLRLLTRAVLTPVVLAIEFPRSSGAIAGLAALLLMLRRLRTRSRSQGSPY